MTRTAVKPYLLAADEQGVFRITVRTTRFNSQGYPLVSSQMLDNGFETATRARAFLRAEYKAEATDIVTK